MRSAGILLLVDNQKIFKVLEHFGFQISGSSLLIGKLRSRGIHLFIQHVTVFGVRVYLDNLCLNL